MKKTLITISAITILFLLNRNNYITPAYAESTNNQIGTFTIYPSYMHGENKSWIILDATPKSSQTDFVTIENITNENQLISIKALETEQNGDSLKIKEENKDNSFINWIEFEKTTYELKPQEKIKVPFQIKVPKNATTGEKTGVILASQTQTNANGLKIESRIGVRLYLNITAPKTLFEQKIEQILKNQIMENKIIKHHIIYGPNKLYLTLSIIIFLASITFFLKKQTK